MYPLVRSACWIVVLLTVLSLGAFADSGWQWQNPSPTGDELRAVAVPDSRNAVAVGAGGTILRTADGGVTWQRQFSGTDDYLSAISFTDANTGWVVGTGGTILHTVDGGASWVPQWRSERRGGCRERATTLRLGQSPGRPR